MLTLVAGDDPWPATSAGERLLFLIIRHHREWHVLARLLSGENLRLGRRYRDFASFFIGASVLHLQQRLVQLAHDVRDQVPSNRDDQVRELRARMCDVLQVTPIEYATNFFELVHETLTSAEQMGREPSEALKKKVVKDGPPYCYSCGRMFYAVYADAPDTPGLEPTADHLWPRALGGDTVEGNLLPACKACNSKKGHLATWHMAWLQPVVFADCNAQGGLEAVAVEVKMALHMRAAMDYARHAGSTLREAYLAIGPREPLVRIDSGQGYDFFNLRVHDDVRTGVTWAPN
jgi:hypothetical protein